MGTGTVELFHGFERKAVSNDDTSDSQNVAKYVTGIMNLSYFWTIF